MGSWVGPEVTMARRPASGSAAVGGSVAPIADCDCRLPPAATAYPVSAPPRWRRRWRAARSCGRGHIRRRPSRPPPARRTRRRRHAAPRHCAVWRDAATCAHSSPAHRARACRWRAAESSPDRRRGRGRLWPSDAPSPARRRRDRRCARAGYAPSPARRSAKTDRRRPSHSQGWRS